MNAYLSNGVVRPEDLYTLTEFTSRLGIKAATIRSARRAGLRVYYAHKQGFIYGRDWIEYVRSSQSRQPSSMSENGT